jgi:acyl-CoA reductase-like NAD-dependent aldehyde dehydrogenase
VQNLSSARKQKGATMLTGGHRSDEYLFEPTVLANATRDMPCARE